MSTMTPQAIPLSRNKLNTPNGIRNLTREPCSSHVATEHKVAIPKNKGIKDKRTCLNNGPLILPLNSYKPCNAPMSSQSQSSQRQTRNTSKAASVPSIASNTKTKKQTSNSRKRALEEVAPSDSETAHQPHKENPATNSSALPDETATAITSTPSPVNTELAANADQASANTPNLTGSPYESLTDVNHAMSDIPISRLIADAQNKTANIGMAEKDIAAPSEPIQPTAED
jgi:hypothetical protein